MSEFGFELPELEGDGIDKESELGIDWAQKTQESVENILNLGCAQFPGVGPFDIPEIKGTAQLPEVKEWIGFNYVLSDRDPAGKGVHFFVDDYQFERIWNRPDVYLDKLARYEVVLSPDFSPYGDMPLVTQLFNHYRKHWCAAYWQMNGINVIPTVRASSDPRSLEWFLDGEPKGSVVAFSTMWGGDATRKEYEKMMRGLNPAHVLIYGKVFDYMQAEGISHIETFADKRWGNG